MNGNEHLFEGIRLVKLAIEADKSFKYEQASILYDQSISRLKLSLNYIDDPYIKELSRKKIKEYENRASLINCKLDEYFRGFIKESPNSLKQFESTQSNNEQSFKNLMFGEISEQSLQDENITDLHKAVIISNQAKVEDNNQQFEKALALYEKAIQYFYVIIEEEENKAIKDHLTKMNNAYIQRVETIKDFLVRTKQFIPDTNIWKSHTHIYQEIMGMGEGVDIRIGLLHKDTSTTFWNDRNSLFMSVNIDKNIIRINSALKINIKLTNLASVKVSNIGIYIKMIETITLPDEKGIMRTESKSTKLNRMTFKKNGVFPMSKGIYNGEIKYIIPDIPITEADFSTSYAREHFLIVQCRIPYHNDLPLEFPIRIIS